MYSAQAHTHRSSRSSFGTALTAFLLLLLCAIGAQADNVYWQYNITLTNGYADGSFANRPGTLIFQSKLPTGTNPYEVQLSASQTATTGAIDYVTSKLLTKNHQNITVAKVTVAVMKTSDKFYSQFNGLYYCYMQHDGALVPGTSSFNPNYYIAKTSLFDTSFGIRTIDSGYTIFIFSKDYKKIVYGYSSYAGVKPGSFSAASSYSAAFTGTKTN